MAALLWPGAVLVLAILGVYWANAPFSRSKCLLESPVYLVQAQQVVGSFRPENTGRHAVLLRVMIDRPLEDLLQVIGSDRRDGANAGSEAPQLLVSARIEPPSGESSVRWSSPVMYTGRSNHEAHFRIAVIDAVNCDWHQIVVRVETAPPALVQLKARITVENQTDWVDYADLAAFERYLLLIICGLFVLAAIMARSWAARRRRTRIRSSR